MYVNGGESQKKQVISVFRILSEKTEYFISERLTGGSGEYSKAWIDNFRVYGGVLSDEAIAKGI